MGNLSAFQTVLEKKPQNEQLGYLKRNNNINAQTPLHVAIEHKRDQIAEYIINQMRYCSPIYVYKTIRSVDGLNFVDKLGRSAFLYTAFYGRLQICKLLKQKEVDVEKVDCYGKNHLHLE